ncbi:ABC transporter ATP-binding protein [Paenibacillus naphthalenovorans]|uniref:ABC transporter ATP-binding protein n=1 Tax=Paenibacillus naphthalenovorans TaxID=162209 RepID=UPI00349EA85F
MWRLLKLEKVTVYHGDVLALKEASIEVAKGKIVALLGSNGAGKSTTINSISGIYRLREGAILLGEEKIHQLTPKEIVERGIVQVPEGRKLFPDLTVIENIQLGAFCKRARASMKERLEMIYAYMPRLYERRKQIAGTLSGGEQQMCAIARGLMAQPDLLMLDEPSLGLAPSMVEQVFEIIAKVNKDGTTVLLVEQSVHRALSICHYAYVLENGKITLSGSGEELLHNDELLSAYLGI